MIKKLRILIYIIFIIFLNSCSKDYPCSHMEEHFKEYNYNPDFIKRSKTNIRRKIDESPNSEMIIVSLIDKELPLNQTNSIDYFNEEGFLVLSVKPQYVVEKMDTTGLSQLPLVETLNFIYNRKTNLPNGMSDSTIFIYDKKNRIIKEEIKKQFKIGVKSSEIIITYEYDDHNNITRSCKNYPELLSTCFNATFIYNKNGNVISEVVDYEGEERLDGKSNIHVIQPKYYEDGKLKTRFDETYIYNKDKLVKKYSKIGDTMGNVVNYQYDKMGNLIKEQEIRATSYSDDPPNKAKVYRYDTFVLRRTYNQQQLITDWYYKANKWKEDYILYKYYYN